MTLARRALPARFATGEVQVDAMEVNGKSPASARADADTVTVTIDALTDYAVLKLSPR